VGVWRCGPFEPKFKAFVQESRWIAASDERPAAAVQNWSILHRWASTDAARNADDIVTVRSLQTGFLARPAIARIRLIWQKLATDIPVTFLPQD